MQADVILFAGAANGYVDATAAAAVAAAVAAAAVAAAAVAAAAAAAAAAYVSVRRFIPPAS